MSTQFGVTCLKTSNAKNREKCRARIPAWVPYIVKSYCIVFSNIKSDILDLNDPWVTLTPSTEDSTKDWWEMVWTEMALELNLLSKLILWNHRLLQGRSRRVLISKFQVTVSYTDNDLLQIRI